MTLHRLLGIIVWFHLYPLAIVAWKQCTEERGGGFCPSNNTCCKTSTLAGSNSIPVTTSACIPTRSQDHGGSGHCCDNDTGCSFGYQCATNSEHDEPYCQLQEFHSADLIGDAPRYGLCHVPQSMRDPIAFPIPNNARDDFHLFQNHTENFQIAYYSNMGDIQVASQSHLSVKTVLVAIHGSSRNFDTYFCAALSMLSLTADESVLVVALKFAAPNDDVLVKKQLVWTEKNNTAISHSWRYGANARNAPISSYSVLDAMLEHIVQGSVQFPNLERISVLGHSAGGQFNHRWALLSSSPIWQSFGRHIHTLVADPRSYCYLDTRRVTSDGTELKVPDPETVAACPGYNQWQWGLDEGGPLSCPYKDRVLRSISVSKLIRRYGSRNVYYLSGELDRLRTVDSCETSIFQGSNRQERARKYRQALTAIYGRQVHSFSIIPGSAHDHTLIFQSNITKRLALGEGPQATAGT